MSSSLHLTFLSRKALSQSRRVKYWSLLIACTVFGHGVTKSVLHSSHYVRSPVGMLIVDQVSPVGYILEPHRQSCTSSACRYCKLHLLKTKVALNSLSSWLDKWRNCIRTSRNLRSARPSLSSANNLWRLAVAGRHHQEHCSTRERRKLESIFVYCQRFYANLCKMCTCIMLLTERWLYVCSTFESGKDVNRSYRQYLAIS